MCKNGKSVEGEVNCATRQFWPHCSALEALAFGLTRALEGEVDCASRLGSAKVIASRRRNQRKVRLFVQFLAVRVFEASHCAQRTSPCAAILSKAVLA